MAAALDFFARTFNDASAVSDAPGPAIGSRWSGLPADFRRRRRSQVIWTASDLPKVTQTLIPHDATSGQIDTLVRERLRSERALYSLNMQVLQSLSPDLIVTQALATRY